MEMDEKDLQLASGFTVPSKPLLEIGNTWDIQRLQGDIQEYAGMFVCMCICICIYIYISM